MEREHPYSVAIERQHPHHPEREGDEVLDHVLNTNAAEAFERHILPIDVTKMNSFESCEQTLNTLSHFKQTAKRTLAAQSLHGKSELEYARLHLQNVGKRARHKEAIDLRGSAVPTAERPARYEKAEAIAKERALNNLGIARWYEEHRDGFERLQELIRDKRDTFDPKTARAA